MLKNYIVIALRKFSRERTYVLINILSLALGIASFLILALYLRSELTYDLHHVNHERIYRLAARFERAGQEGDAFAVSQRGFGPLFTKDFPQVGQFVRFQRSTQNLLQYGDIKKQWERIYLADPTVFDVFTHEPIYGDPKTAFDDPYSIAISETFAKHYFGDENPIGKKLSSGAYSYAVTLVFEDLPENSHLKYDALFPMSLLEVFIPGINNNLEATLWNVGLYTYFMVPPEFDPADFQPLSQRFVDAHMSKLAAQLKATFTAGFQPLAGLHFGEKLLGDELTGNVFYVYGFAAVAVFILLIACINYMNLATARATKRAKEVGMRKVLGANQPELIAQFLGESMTFTVIALVVGLMFVELALALTPIGSLMGKEHLLSAGADPKVLGGIVLLALIVGLAAGLYPAFYLSAISPLSALTQVKRSWKAGLSMRQILVVAQLLISIGVIACTLLMTDQIRYVHEKPLGFDKENRLIVTLRGYDVVKDAKTIRNELEKQPGVLDTTTIAVVPGTGNSVNLIETENNAGVIEPMSMDTLPVGLNFVQAMGVKLIEGRGFSEDVATDVREAVLVNESLVKQFGWDQAIGKRFKFGPNFARVVGVVEDFHYASLHNKVGPLLMRAISDAPGPVPPNQRALVTTSIVVVMAGDGLRDTMDRVQQVIAKFDPNFNFEPKFLEDQLNELYKSETNLMRLTGIFGGICIFISVMGLFGLAAFTTEQRTKEIGIRKVLGASDPEIVNMLSRSLLPLILIAAIPASVIGFYAIGKWLERFAYHTDINPLTFAFATIVVTFVALATVVLQSLKTARSDPIDALRYE
jgi:putative ABC transport system permease protein